jgi:hypothetical protein
VALQREKLKSGGGVAAAKLSPKSFQIRKDLPFKAVRNIQTLYMTDIWLSPKITSRRDGAPTCFGRCIDGFS